MQHVSRSVRTWRRLLAFGFALGMGAWLPSAALAGTRISDFNGDGYADVAIAAPLDKDFPAGVVNGVVHVIYGASSGLHVSTSAPTQWWHQQDLGFTSAEDDDFGESMAVGDFDGDGYADLAIGASGKTLGTLTHCGLVYVLYGTSTGLSKTRAQALTENFGGLGGSDYENRYGELLAAGDFDGDGDDDLAVATWIGGRVYVLKGTPDRLSATGARRIDPTSRSATFAGSFRVDVKTYGNVPASLAVGNFGKGAADDLAIGYPAVDLVVTNLLTSQQQWISSAGAVHVYYGNVDGIVTNESDYLIQGWVLGSDRAESFDYLGEALAAGDFDDDGWDDLAIGVPREDLPHLSIGAQDAGAVHVVYGGTSGITNGAPANALRRPDQFWHQDVGTLPGSVFPDDQFGASLAAGNFGFGFQDDLAIGVPRDNLGSANNTGAVQILFGAAGGLSEANNRLYTQNSADVPGTAETYDGFGRALAAGNFGSSRLGNYDDLAVGAPGDRVPESFAGSVTIFYGGSSGPLGTGNFQFWTQDSYGIPGYTQASEEFGAVLAAR